MLSAASAPAAEQVFTLKRFPARPFKISRELKIFMVDWQLSDINFRLKRTATKGAVQRRRLGEAEWRDSQSPGLIRQSGKLPLWIFDQK